ncbi:MAG: Uma2 family endonuclease [Acidobacteria bacterium]|nr:Uma2 family endonuclease [Acidobacteriota bacterium]
MGTAVKALPLEEYLSNPAYERCEWIDGEAVELNVGNKPHSNIQGNASVELGLHLRQKGLGRLAVELRCRLRVRGQTRIYLPDLAVVLSDPNPDELRYLDGAPDLVVEIRSPDDALSALHRKIQDYLANGAKLAWVILPEERAVLVFTPNAPTRTVMAGETMDGGDLLPDLKFPVDALFA